MIGARRAHNIVIYVGWGGRKGNVSQFIMI